MKTFGKLPLTGHGMFVQPSSRSEEMTEERLKQIEKFVSDSEGGFLGVIVAQPMIKELLDENQKLRDALEKIADPRKRDHQEPDAYTQLGCVMEIAAKALDREALGEK